MQVRFYSVEFYDSSGHLEHNALMTPTELGEHLIHNREHQMTVKIGPKMQTEDCLCMSHEERGVRCD